jgi:hypothetical protein
MTRQETDDDLVTATALAAADRIRGQLGIELTPDVEEALAGSPSAQLGERYLDPISLASLVVAAATLAWTVYRDLRKSTPSPSREAIVADIHLRLNGYRVAHGEEAVDIVVDEVVLRAEACDDR